MVREVLSESALWFERSKRKVCGGEGRTSVPILKLRNLSCSSSSKARWLELREEGRGQSGGPGVRGPTAD